MSVAGNKTRRRTILTGWGYVLFVAILATPERLARGSLKTIWIEAGMGAIFASAIALTPFLMSARWSRLALGGMLLAGFISTMVLTPPTLTS